MPNPKNPQPLLDISKMDIETCITIPAIKLKYLSKNKTNMEQTICFNSWMKDSLSRLII